MIVGEIYVCVVVKLWFLKCSGGIVLIDEFSVVVGEDLSVFLVDELIWCWSVDIVLLLMCVEVLSSWIVSF